ncbi:hypothetical protein [Streptomyces graminofaciens]|nr:hypothetical protein [Streptomyces graminofaciens]
MSDTLGNLDPADISVDDEGRITAADWRSPSRRTTSLARRGSSAR